MTHSELEKKGRELMHMLLQEHLNNCGPGKCDPPVEGAEAVLRLHALRSSRDFDEYWVFHEAREYGRNHQSRYADGIVPLTIGSRPAYRRDNLKIIK